MDEQTQTGQQPSPGTDEPPIQTSIEQLAPCKVMLRINVPAPRVDETFELIAEEFRKHARLTGFRPGKAPHYLVVRTFASEIEREVRRRLLGESYQRALKEHNVRPLGQPEVEEVQFARGQEFQYIVRCETEPAFELPDYKGLPVEVESRTVTPEDIDRALETLREQRANFIVVTRPVQTGDFAVVSYQGTCEGKPISELEPTARSLTEQKDFWMKVEPGQFIPGFTDRLVGASAGETRTVTVTFPADFAIPVLVGKQGTYHVEVVQVKERQLPEVNDEFARQFGVDTVEALRDGIRNDLDNELRYKRLTGIRNQLVNALLRRVNCELPESIVQNETRNVVRDIVFQNQKRGLTKEAINRNKDEIFAVASHGAKDRVKAALILNRIAEKEGIKVTEEELAHRITQIAQERNERPEKLVREFRQSGQIHAVAEQILTAKVLDFIQLHALMTEVPARTA